MGIGDKVKIVKQSGDFLISSRAHKRKQFEIMLDNPTFYLLQPYNPNLGTFDGGNYLANLGRGEPAGLIRVDAVRRCFDSPALVARKVATKDGKLSNSSAGEAHEHEVEDWTMTVRERNQFAIYRGWTRFKSAFDGVTCDGRAEVDRGCSLSLEPERGK